MFYIGQVQFPSFNMAAICAIKHAQQRNVAVKIKKDDGTVLADFVPGRDNTVSIQATEYGKPFVEDLC